MISIKNNIDDNIIKAYLENLIKQKFTTHNKPLKNLINTIENTRDNLSGRFKKKDNHFRLVLNYLLSKITESDLNNNLITMSPDSLNIEKDFIERNYKSVLDSEYRQVKGKIKKKSKTYRSLLREIFYYDDYDRWDAYALAKKLNVNVCPYCNRMPTFTLGNSIEKGARPQFDHFFDKASFPYLSLSIYNLVPCCSICNSSYKHSKKFNLSDHFHPYIKGFDCENIKFTLDIKNIEDFLNVIVSYGSISKYEIKFKSESQGKLPKNISDLGLEKLYNYDLSYTDEIIKKKLIYNNDYIDSLFDQWGDVLFSSKGEIKNLVMGNYLNNEDLNNRPLSKLTKDITEELKIF